MSAVFTDERASCRYAIGLDVGIASVGYAIVALDSQDQPVRIIRIGSRVFDKAEHPKNGESLNLPRRQARSMRRRLRRQRHRLERIRNMIVNNGILTRDALLGLYDRPVSDVYELRVRALDEAVSAEEFARILINLAQRRGFKSNRKKVTSKEDGKLLKAVHENDALMEQRHYRTVGEMLFRDEKFAEHKRNKGSDYQNTVARDDIEKEARLIFAAQRQYGCAFASEEIEDKFIDILLSQRLFSEGPGPRAGEKTEPEERIRQFQNQVEKMRGTCTLKGKDYPRAPKASFSFQDFNLWQHLNHLRIQRKGAVLKADEIMPGARQMLHDWVMQKGTVSFYDIRQKLGLADTDRFCGIQYTAPKPKKGSKVEATSAGEEDIVKTMESKKKLNDMRVYAEIRSCICKAGKDKFAALSVDQLDAIGEALCKNNNDERITQDLQKAAIDPAVIEQLLTLDNFPTFGHISVAACRELIPVLQNGLTYDKACEKAGYNFKQDDKLVCKFLPSLLNGSEESKKEKEKNEETIIRSEDELIQERIRDQVREDARDITSPVVKRAVSQTIKVVNAIIREMNEVSPVYINLELARELAHSYKEREEIKAGQDANAALNEDLRQELIKDFNTPSPRGLDIVKLKLYKEQDGRCPYSGQIIDPQYLLKDDYVEIDHIVPYSKCFDNSYINKVLVLTAENRQKGNRLPLEYLTGEKRDRFLTWVEQSHLKGAKKGRLLKEKLTDEDAQDFRQRNLTDTQFISSFMNRYITRYLAFSPFYTDRKRHVLCVNGTITAYVRARWGITKVRSDGDTHHAVDALVIACITQGMINRITKFSKYHELAFAGDIPVDTETGEVIGADMTEDEKKQFPMPWEGFHKELEIRLMQNETELLQCLTEFDEKHHSYEGIDLTTVKPIFVSRMSDHKVTGKAHKDTFRSGVCLETEGKTVAKTSLIKLNLGGKPASVDPSLLYKGNYIEGYYQPNSDRLLYEALIDRLLQFGGKGKDAFVQPFYKPKANGEPGPLVKSVKICDVASSAVPVLGGNAVADNDTIVRTDVFYVDGDGYYFVPVYVADTVKKELPNIAPVAGKDKTGKKKRKQVDDADFCFSLYKNDLIRIVKNGDFSLEPVTTKSKSDKKKPVKDRKLVTNDENNGNNEHSLFLFYTSFDRKNASFEGIVHDGTYKLRGIGKTTTRIEKFEVDVLGNIRKVGKETRKRFC